MTRALAFFIFSVVSISAFLSPAAGASEGSGGVVNGRKATHSANNSVTHPWPRNIKFYFETGYFQSGRIAQDLQRFEKLRSDVAALAGVEPKVEVNVGRILSVYNKKRGQLIDANVLVDQLKGCTDFDVDCQGVITTMNPGVPWKSAEFEGELSLPTKGITFEVQVCAKDQATEEAINKAIANVKEVIMPMERMLMDGEVIWQLARECQP